MGCVAAETPEAHGPPCGELQSLPHYFLSCLHLFICALHAELPHLSFLDVLFHVGFCSQPIKTSLNSVSLSAPWQPSLTSLCSKAEKPDSSVYVYSWRRTRKLDYSRCFHHWWVMRYFSVVIVRHYVTPLVFRFRNLPFIFFWKKETLFFFQKWGVCHLQS